MGSWRFRVVYLLMYFVHSGREKIFGFFGGGDSCSTPVVAELGFAIDKFEPAAGLSLVRGVSLANFRE